MKISLPFRMLRKRDCTDKQREAFERSCSALTERLECIRSSFDMAQDNDVIDALIYEENAVLCRLAQLYKQARREGIALDIYERKRL